MDKYVIVCRFKGVIPQFYIENPETKIGTFTSFAYKIYETKEDAYTKLEELSKTQVVGRFLSVCSLKNIPNVTKVA